MSIAFQSLLYWNTSENSDKNIQYNDCIVFQSLLYWNTSENKKNCRSEIFSERVSILVVLEYL